MTADTVGGVWTYALELAQALGNLGIEIAIATMGAPLTSEQHQAINHIPNLKLFESNYKLEWMPDPWQDIDQAGDWLLQLEKHLQPDFVHLNSYIHGSLPWRTPTLIVAHSCVLSWWLAVKGKTAPPDWNHYQQAVQQGLRSVDLIVAPSQAMLSALEHHYGPLPTGTVIPNSRNPTLFFPGDKKEIIFSVGRLWDEAKNVAILEQIAADLPWKIYVAGANEHPNGGKAQLNHVHHLGQLTEKAIAPWFSRAAIYALPARYEPFGLSALEAALAECALVLGDIPSLREVWGRAAIFVPPDDADTLKATLIELISNTQQRQILATRARARALELTPQHLATNYQRVYREGIYKHQSAKLRSSPLHF